jgi:hypothetical protein
MRPDIPYMDSPLGEELERGLQGEEAETVTLGGSRCHLCGKLR